MNPSPNVLIAAEQLQRRLDDEIELGEEGSDRERALRQRKLSLT